VPNFQLESRAVHDKVKAIALALALVSIFLVLDVVLNGPKEELAAVSFG
jgi:hypothetical protein